MLAGIDEAMLVASPGPRQFLRVRQASVRESLTQYLESCQGTLESMRAIGEDGWTDEALLADLANEAANSFVSLAVAHLELTGYLPPTSRIREDLTYLLFRAAGLSLMSRTHESLITMIVERTVQWSARSDEGGHSGVAVSVPWLEALTPLRWPLAVHELGHYLLPGGQQVAPRVDRLQLEHDWGEAERDAFMEILADAIAERYCGPSFAQALAREGYLISLGLTNRGEAATTEQSVSVKRRLELLACPTMPVESLPAAWNLGPRADPPLELVSDQVTSEMRTCAVDLLGPTQSDTDPDAIHQAAALLDLPQPVPALTRVVDADRVVRLEGIVLQGQAPAADEAVELTTLVVQRALTDAEVFSAAWHAELSKDRDAYVGGLMLDSVNDSDLAAASAQVSTRDTWLAQSLQAAAVHRWLDAGRLLKERHGAV